jgi:hypothetical protein
LAISLSYITPPPPRDAPRRCVVSALLVGEADERRHAAAALASLAAAPANHRELHEADGVAALLDVLRGGGGAEAALVRAP